MNQLPQMYSCMKSPSYSLGCPSELPRPHSLTWDNCNALNSCLYDYGESLKERCGQKTRGH